MNEEYLKISNSAKKLEVEYHKARAEWEEESRREKNKEQYLEAWAVFQEVIKKKNAWMEFLMGNSKILLPHAKK